MDAPLLQNDSADRIITTLVQNLHALEQRGDSASWEKAETYLAAYDDLRHQPEYDGMRGLKLSRAINDDIRTKRSKLRLLGPRVSFLSHALKMAETWPEVFVVHNKEVPFEHYRHLACCGLPVADRQRLREWAEAAQCSQEELRQRIREEVDGHNGIHKPDFELKVSNFWKFNSHHDNDGYGGVHPLIYANLLYWFTVPGDTVLDPMAGTALLAHVLGNYRYFRESYEAEGSGQRTALMSDIAPRSPAIAEADATRGLPFSDGCAKLAIIDPPYLQIADGKEYANLGKNIETWLHSLDLISQNVLRCLRADGLIAVITDDVLRKGNHQPIAYLVTSMLAKLGFTPVATIYNHNPNFVYTMGPAMMKAARTAKVLCNGCKIIQVSRLA